MADEAIPEAIPSISSGVVGSRFVTQSDVEAARTRREEQWKAAYARFLSLSSSSMSFFLPASLNNPSSALGWAKNPRPHRKKMRTMVVVWQRSAPISPMVFHHTSVFILAII
jgi:hypothetical protein